MGTCLISLSRRSAVRREQELSRLTALLRADAVPGVEGRYLAGFGKGRVVDNRTDEVLQGAAVPDQGWPRAMPGSPLLAYIGLAQFLGFGPGFSTAMFLAYGMIVALGAVIRWLSHGRYDGHCVPHVEPTE